MRKVFLASSALIFISTSAFADNTETVVVTATRTPEPAKLTGTSIDVITANDLQNQQINFVTDALAEVPGLSMSRTGGAGQTTSIFIRGANSGQSLFLIDGVRLEDPSATDGGAVLQDVLVNNIDRIEVLRGPQSTLYGSDAMGGVVNILSRRGGDQPFAFTGSAEGGSFGTWHGNIAADGTEGRVEYGAAVNYFDTDGTSAADSRNGNTEADGYRNFGATFNTRIHATDDISVDLRGYYTDSHVDFDGFPPPNFTFQDDPEFGKNTLYAGYAGLNVSLLDGRFTNLLALIGLNSDRKDFGNFDFLTGAFSPTINFYGKGGSGRFEYEGVFQVNDTNELVFGAESQHTTLETHSVFDLTPLDHGSRTTDGYYGQWQSTLFEALTLTGGVRYDHDSEFGGHTSVKLNGAYNIDSTGTTLRAAYGDGFKAPSLYELFSDFSNPVTALKPEQSHGWEAGIDQPFLDGNAKASLTYFQSNYDNLIDFFSCFGIASPACTLRAFAGGYYFNVNRARTDGVEGELTAKIVDTLSADANFTTLTARNETNGFPLAKRPDFSANGTLTWAPTPDWSLGGGVNYVGPRYNDAFGSVRLSSSTEANLFGSWQFVEHWQVYGRVDNLFDDRSEPVSGYGRPGRAFFAGVRTAF
ncbi:MAG TPA: TonB-dependent receptor [Rhizomicrobium sp.]|jgi:vitamin B12 transporter